MRNQLRVEIRRVQQELGTTTLFVTHDQSEALSIADRVGVMRAGQLEQCDVPATLYDRPATPFVATFVGSMNRMHGTAEADGRVRVGSQVLPADGTAPSPGAEVTVLVRPEAVVVAADETGPYVVVVSTFRGSTTRLRLQHNDGAEVLAGPLALIAEIKKASPSKGRCLRPRP